MLFSRSSYKRDPKPKALPEWVVSKWHSGRQGGNDSACNVTTGVTGWGVWRYREQRSRVTEIRKGRKTHVYFASETHCSPKWASAQKQNDTQAEEAVSLTTCSVPRRPSRVCRDVGMNWHVWNGLQDGLWTKGRWTQSSSPGMQATLRFNLTYVGRCVRTTSPKSNSWFHEGLASAFLFSHSVQTCTAHTVFSRELSQGQNDHASSSVYWRMFPNMQKWQNLQSHSLTIMLSFWLFKEFLMWTIFKVFTEFVRTLLLFLCFYLFIFLTERHMGSQFPDQGSNPHSLHWKTKSQLLDCQAVPVLVILDAAGHTFWS